MKCQKGTETKRQRSSSSQRCNHACTGRDGFRDQVEINCFYIPKTLQYLHACGQRSVCSAVMGSEGEVVRVTELKPSQPRYAFRHRPTLTNFLEKDHDLIYSRPW